jgi:hypothetical protein
MAEGQKIGEGMAQQMAQKGIEELRAAVLQQPAQEPQPPSYQQQLDAAASRGQVAERSRGMER